LGLVVRRGRGARCAGRRRRKCRGGRRGRQDSRRRHRKDGLLFHHVACRGRRQGRLVRVGEDEGDTENGRDEAEAHPHAPLARRRPLRRDRICDWLGGELPVDQAVCLARDVDRSLTGVARQHSFLAHVRVHSLMPAPPAFPTRETPCGQASYGRRPPGSRSGTFEDYPGPGYSGGFLLGRRLPWPSREPSQVRETRRRGGVKGSPHAVRNRITDHRHLALPSATTGHIPTSSCVN
jgi:hypothetical protein